MSDEITAKNANDLSVAKIAPEPGGLSSGARPEAPFTLPVPGCEAEFVTPEERVEARNLRSKSIENKLAIFPAMDEVDRMIEHGDELTEIRNFILNYQRDDKGKPVFPVGMTLLKSYVERKKIARARSGKPLIEHQVERLRRHKEIMREKRSVEKLFERVVDTPLDEIFTDVSGASSEASRAMKAKTTEELEKRTALMRLSGSEARFKGMATIWQGITVAEFLKDEGVQLEGIVPRTVADWVALSRFQLDGIKLLYEMMGKSRSKKDIVKTLTSLVKHMGMTPYGPAIETVAKVVDEEDAREVEEVVKVITEGNDKDG